MSALCSIRGTFPDQQVVIDDIIAEGDKVVVRTRLRGTHQGSALPTFRGIPLESRTVEKKCGFLGTPRPKNPHA